MAGVQTLDVGAAVDEGEQAGGCACRDPERIGDLRGIEAADFRDRDRRAERPDRAGRVKAALAQVRRAGAGEADCNLVAGDYGLDQPWARNAALIANTERGRNDRAAAMRR